MAKVTLPVCDLDAVEAFGLSKAVTAKLKKALRSELGAGIYPVDITVRVHGSLRVAADTEKVPTVRIPQKALLGLFLARSGALREANLALLQECVGEVIKASLLAEATGEEEDEEEVTDSQLTVEEALQAKYAEQFDLMVAGFLQHLEKIPVKGSVKADLGIERIVTELDSEDGFELV